MADLPARSELFRRWRNSSLATTGTKISAREIDREGSDANLLAAASSIMGEEMVGRMARALAGCFEDTATGDGLDRVVFDRKGLARKPAIPAVGQVVLSRPTAAAGAGAIDGGPPGSLPAPTRIRTNRGINYILTEPAIFGALDLTQTVDVQAELAGLAYEVDASQAWTWVDTPFDSTIAISNPVEMAGAADEESDESYRSRAKGFFPTIRRGTIGAIQFGLLSTPGIESATVIETIDPDSGFPVAVVQAFILDALGHANETLAARGLLTLLEYRAAGIAVSIVPGEPQFVEIEFVNTAFDTSIVLDTSAAADDVRGRIVAALNNQRPGQTLLRSTILAAARNVPGFIVEDTDLIEPAAALVPSSTSIAFRTRKELISLS